MPQTYLIQTLKVWWCIFNFENHRYVVFIWEPLLHIICAICWALALHEIHPLIPQNSLINRHYFYFRAIDMENWRGNLSTNIKWPWQNSSPSLWTLKCKFLMCIAFLLDFWLNVSFRSLRHVCYLVSNTLPVPDLCSLGCPLSHSILSEILPHTCLRWTPGGSSWSVSVLHLPLWPWAPLRRSWNEYSKQSI